MVLENLGVGLLPVPTIALLSTGVVLWRERKRCYYYGGHLGEQRRNSLLISAMFLGYWIFYLVVEIVKCVRLHELERVHPGKGSKYPSSDMFLDNIVLVGLYAVFVCLESILLVRGWLRNNRFKHLAATRSYA
jgi:hypothetical protein